MMPIVRRDDKLTPFVERRGEVEAVVEQASWSEGIEGRQAMQTPEDVQGMLKLASLGWGTKRISRELGCSRNTVRSYLRRGGWQPYRRRPFRVRPGFERGAGSAKVCGQNGNTLRTRTAA
jgi:hypothetical protein